MRNNSPAEDGFLNPRLLFGLKFCQYARRALLAQRLRCLSVVVHSAHATDPTHAAATRHAATGAALVLLRSFGDDCFGREQRATDRRAFCNALRVTLVGSMPATSPLNSTKIRPAHADSVNSSVFFGWKFLRPVAAFQSQRGAIVSFIVAKPRRGVCDVRFARTRIRRPRFCGAASGASPRMCVLRHDDHNIFSGARKQFRVRRKNGRTKKVGNPISSADWKCWDAGHDHPGDERQRSRSDI